MKPPHTITIKSDENLLTFVSQTKDMYTYKYKKSVTKMNQHITLSENELEKLIKQNQ